MTAFKFCAYQQIQLLCEEHGLERRLCSYDKKLTDPLCICPIQPEEVIMVPQAGNNAVYLAFVNRCPKFSPTNLKDYLLLTDMVFDKTRYLIVESNIEYLLIDKVKEEQELFKKDKPIVSKHNLTLRDKMINELKDLKDEDADEYDD